MNYIYKIIGFFSLFLFIACGGNEYKPSLSTGTTPIFPDYADVTIPATIAPLNFKVNSESSKVKAVFQAKEVKLEVMGIDREIMIAPQKWSNLIENAGEKPIKITVFVSKDGEWEEHYGFKINISKDAIDPYLVYRLIEPGYELWHKMGIYQRNLSDFKETVVYENENTGHNCVNCHTPNNRKPDEFLLHMRAKHGGTILVKDGIVKKLNTNYTEKIKGLVYPSWHPNGEYIAFSVNDTKQTFHANDSNRIEVFDLYSDIVILDIKSNKLITSEKLSADSVFETFPTFSPDGKKLFFCAANAIAMPDSIMDIRYGLYAVDLDLQKGYISNKIDTLYNPISQPKSVSFPRVSPDGRFLMYTLSKYGNFSIWHRDADLRLIDLTTGEDIDISTLNSDEAESYHTWSSNGRWIVFSSRRIDGLYTRPYIAHIDSNGVASKPFLLPQEKGQYYDMFNKSYNIPEFITGKINRIDHKIRQIAQSQGE